MRKTLIVVVVFVLASTITPFGLHGQPGGDCFPEDPYLFCGYQCYKGGCSRFIYTPEDSWCVLQFPGCDGGLNHACCDFSGGF